MLPALALAPLVVACPKVVPLPHGPEKPETYKLLSEAPEAETATRTEQRPDVYVRTEQFDHVPVVVAKGQAGPLSLHGGRAELCADEACARGIEVDNFILFEVADASDGKVKHRFVAGYHEGLSVDDQEPDNVGASGFTLEPHLDVTAQLPQDEPFVLRATALDYGGVGRVSDVYLRVSRQESRAPTEDELRK